MVVVVIVAVTVVVMVVVAVAAAVASNCGPVIRKQTEISCFGPTRA
jgi:hypothetical protein